MVLRLVESMVDYKRPTLIIPRVPGNSPYADFIRACKGGANLRAKNAQEGDQYIHGHYRKGWKA